MLLTFDPINPALPILEQNIPGSTFVEALSSKKMHSAISEAFGACTITGSEAENEAYLINASGFFICTIKPSTGAVNA